MQNSKNLSAFIRTKMSDFDADQRAEILDQLNEDERFFVFRTVIYENMQAIDRNELVNNAVEAGIRLQEQMKSDEDVYVAFMNNVPEVDVITTVYGLAKSEEDLGAQFETHVNRYITINGLDD